MNGWRPDDELYEFSARTSDHLEMASLKATGSDFCGGQGRAGALRMGLEHGAFCVGCCWVVMGLVFYGGVMNLYWILGLAALVLVEKLLPAGHRLGNISGLGFLVWGTWLLMSSA
jgi:predicted metal-binding membrane protein